MRSSSNSNQYYALLKKKNEILKELLAYTESKKFKIEEEEIDHINLYLRKREKLFSDLLIIEKEIKKIEFVKQEESFSSVKKEVTELTKKNNEIIKKIIDLDTINSSIFKNISYTLKNSIKTTKEAQRINNKYNSVYNIGSVGGYFDSIQ